MDNSKKITDILEQHRGERHAIILHGFPDPDAIAAGYAHRLLSSYYDIECDIIYSGRISHRQNIALVKVLGIDLIQYQSNMSLQEYQGAVFVDNQGVTVGEIVSALENSHVPILIVVDHHEPQDKLHPEYLDIRRVGATATIYSEYLEQGPLKLDKSKREHVIAATALMHGILTDTSNFILAGAEDFHAAAFLSLYRDSDLLGQIMSQSRSKAVMEIIRRALGDRVVVENFSIAGIGYLRAEDRDAIPQAAEFLLTEENAHTAVVYGIMKDANNNETLIGSMRTNRITIDPDEFIKEVFGKSTEGNYYGGGKVTAGAFNIPIGFLAGGDSDDKYQDNKWKVYDAQVRSKILSKLGVELRHVDQT